VSAFGWNLRALWAKHFAIYKSFYRYTDTILHKSINQNYKKRRKKRKNPTNPTNL
jgi:hypothetical protein